MALKSNEVLGLNAQVQAWAERETVEDALLIVNTYGPWGADLNDAHRRQIVLADEVKRLQSVYSMAVQGRADMRSRVKELTLAEDGAKEAYGVLVQSKHDAEAECKHLRELLQAAYAQIRQRPVLPECATEPMQKAMQRAVLLRKSMNDVWRAALVELEA